MFFNFVIEQFATIGYILAEAIGTYLRIIKKNISNEKYCKVLLF
jgi:hypothetical protein